MIQRNHLASPVRGARQNGHAPSHAFGWAQKAIYAGSMVISLDAGYRGENYPSTEGTRLHREGRGCLDPKLAEFRPRLR